MIDTELGLADLASVDKAVERAGKAIKGGDKDAMRRRDLLVRLQEHLNAGAPGTLDGDDRR